MSTTHKFPALEAYINLPGLEAHERWGGGTNPKKIDEASARFIHWKYLLLINVYVHILYIHILYAYDVLLHVSKRIVFY